MSKSSSAKRSQIDPKAWLALGVAITALVAVTLFVGQKPDEDRQQQEVVLEEGQNKKPPAEPADGKKIPDGYVRIGGVDRPETDVKPEFDSELPDKSTQGQEMGYGLSPPFDPDANPQTRSVADALTQKKFPERLSPAISPKAFDRKAFKANPNAWVNTIEPGRVFQPAQPGRATPRILTFSRRYQRITQGETVALRVRVTPGAPVTFTSFDLGAFENQLTSINVLANLRGVATARFTGTAGTINDVRILAASPIASGQVNFRVNVSLPKFERR